MVPSVSIVIPVYNKRPFLEEAVRSALAQAVDKLELIIIDDESSDGSLELAQRLAQEDGRIRVLNQENQGEARARNAGMRAATGEYVALLDGDDVLPAGKLRTQLAAFAGRPDLAVVFSDTVIIDEQGRRVSDSDTAFGKAKRDSPILWQLASRLTFTIHSGLIRRSALEHIGYHEEHAPDVSPDWELWYRLAEHSDFMYQAEPAVFYRQHKAMMTRQVPRRDLFVKHVRTLEYFQARPSFAGLPIQVQAESHLRRAVLCLRAGLDGEARPALRRARDLHDGSLERGLAATAAIPFGPRALRAAIELRDRPTVRLVSRACGLR